MYVQRSTIGYSHAPHASKASVIIASSTLQGKYLRSESLLVRVFNGKPLYMLTMNAMSGLYKAVFSHGAFYRIELNDLNLVQ